MRSLARCLLRPNNQQELKREDVAGTNMEVVISLVEAVTWSIKALRSTTYVRNRAAQPPELTKMSDRYLWMC